ncbi:Stealth CR1 domain-containing protein [Moraxella sp. VT-16-12]|uniref:Stealth CR1 domain-containing protein n=1 Tax=Moraxella sp. VT-16-12 TaxID=2014877 RepID=UPI000B7FF97B|nr:Stealth CR1 domain-containing protein [Moraxella sp. VT-16-12]TWV82419.1 capsule biosynthesis protein CapC [Moraxella sp. VT-16-12]
MKIWRKIRKLIKTPGIFFRDYFDKRYPFTHTELQMSKNKEVATLLGEQDSRVFSSKECPVDVVYTWVDNTDPLWQERYQFHKSIYENNHQSLGKFATNDARFENHDELYYSIKSVQRNMPWIRNIYLVTDNQVPKWIGGFQDVILVFHHQIIDGQYLPTFNSHVIEAFLYRIPELSENFLYFNDDVFVAKPLKKSHFFSANGVASLFVSAKRLSDIQKRGLDTPTLSACMSVQSLLQNQFPIKIDNTLVHTYYPLKKSAYEQAWTMFKEEIVRFLPNKFRTNNDLNMATFLVPWLMYCQQQSVEKIDVCYYFNIRSRTALTCYDKLLKQQDESLLPHSFCANDFYVDNNSQIPDYKEKLIQFLNKYYTV